MLFIWSNALVDDVAGAHAIGREAAGLAYILGVLNIIDNMYNLLIVTNQALFRN